MSTLAVGLGAGRTARFYQGAIGKKIVMAATGFVLFGYVLAHLIGNLQIYLGPEQINAYARFLHSMPPLLWTARIVLLACVVLHIVSSVQLWALNRAARPDRYVKTQNVPAGYASRTMLWSGPIIGFFVLFHILHLTTGSVNLPFQELDVYNNLVNGFRLLPVSITYIVAMILLSMHLYHGLWSMFQTLGVSHPRYTPWLKRFAAAFAIFIAVGNISIPVAVLAGLVGS
jgi:succinate dehydrogenase / fumarate reductase cytochrome b subunit